MARNRVKHEVAQGSAPRVYELNPAPGVRPDNQPKSGEVHRVPPQKNILPSAEDLISQLKRALR